MTATSLSAKASFKTKVDDFINRNLDVLLVFTMVISLFSLIGLMGYSYEMDKKFARGMYIEANYERIFQGEINLKDVQILNKMGGTESLTEDWKFFMDKTQNFEDSSALVK